MTDVSKDEIRKLLNEKAFRNDVLDAVAASTDVGDDLIGNIVDELSDMIENDPTFKSELINRLFEDADAKEKVLNALVEELQ